MNRKYAAMKRMEKNNGKPSPFFDDRPRRGSQDGSGTNDSTFNIPTITSALIILILSLALGLALAPFDFEVTERLNLPEVDFSELKVETVLRSERLFDGKLAGPESLVILKDGRGVTTAEHGQLHLLDFQQNTVEDLGVCQAPNKCGRPLGLKILEDGVTLIVADATVGVYQYNLKTREQKILLASNSTLDGVRTIFYDDVAINDHVIYATHVSDVFSYEQVPAVVASGDCTGRIAFYDMKSSLSGFLPLRPMWFPNGIEVSHDRKYLLINENTAFRILKVKLSNDPRSMSDDEVMMDAPGVVDNIRRSKRGNSYWVGIPMARDRENKLISHEKLLGSTISRKLLSKLSALKLIDLKSLTTPYGAFMEIDGDGKVVRFFEDKSGTVFTHVSEVIDLDEKTLLVMSYYENVKCIVKLYLK